MENQDIRIVDLIVKNIKEIYEDWIKVQLSSENLRDDLISIEELKVQSKEFLE